MAVEDATGFRHLTPGPNVSLPIDPQVIASPTELLMRFDLADLSSSREIDRSIFVAFKEEDTSAPLTDFDELIDGLRQDESASNILWHGPFRNGYGWNLVGWDQEQSNVRRFPGQYSPSPVHLFGYTGIGINNRPSSVPDSSGATWDYLTLLIDAFPTRALGTIYGPQQLAPPVEQVTRSTWDNLDADLRASFHEEPVEDGVTHAAEGILESALLGDAYSGILDWISQATTDTSNPAHSASILRCLGRLSFGLSTARRVKIVDDALRTDNLEIRDAAVQAAERWGDKPLIEILIAHDEPEVWLAEYIEEVISDLSE